MPDFWGGVQGGVTLAPFYKHDNTPTSIAPLPADMVPPPDPNNPPFVPTDPGWLPKVSPDPGSTRPPSDSSYAPPGSAGTTYLASGGGQPASSTVGTDPYHLLPPDLHRALAGHPDAGVQRAYLGWVAQGGVAPANNTNHPLDNPETTLTNAPHGEPGSAPYASAAPVIDRSAPVSDRANQNSGPPLKPPVTR